MHTRIVFIYAWVMSLLTTKSVSLHTYVSEYAKCKLEFCAYHEWSAEGLQHLLRATKRFPQGVLCHFVMESVISPKFSGTQIIFRLSHSNRLISGDTEYNLSGY